MQNPKHWQHIDGLGQERRNSSALATDLRLSCSNPSICVCNIWNICDIIPQRSVGRVRSGTPRRRPVKPVLWTRTVTRTGTSGVCPVPRVRPRWSRERYLCLSVMLRVSLKTRSLFQCKDRLFHVRDLHNKDMTVVRPSYLYNGNLYIGKTTSLHWEISGCCRSILYPPAARP